MFFCFRRQRDDSREDESVLSGRPTHAAYRQILDSAEGKGGDIVSPQCLEVKGFFFYDADKKEKKMHFFSLDPLTMWRYCFPAAIAPSSSSSTAASVRSLVETLAFAFHLVFPTFQMFSSQPGLRPLLFSAMLTFDWRS